MQGRSNSWVSVEQRISGVIYRPLLAVPHARKEIHVPIFLFRISILQRSNSKLRLIIIAHIFISVKQTLNYNTWDFHYDRGTDDRPGYVPMFARGMLCLWSKGRVLGASPEKRLAANSRSTASTSTSFRTSRVSST